MSSRALSCAVIASLATGCIVVREPDVQEPPQERWSGQQQRRPAPRQRLRPTRDIIADGVWYQENRRYGEAIVAFREVIRREPRNDGAHAYLGLVYLNMGRYPLAGRALRTALGLNVNNAAAHFNLGLVHQRMGRHPEAAREFFYAFRLDPEHGETYYHIGVECMAIQEYRCADEALRRFVAVMRPSAESREAIADARARLWTLHAMFQPVQARAAPAVVAEDEGEEEGEGEDEDERPAPVDPAPTPAPVAPSPPGPTAAVPPPPSAPSNRGASQWDEASRHLWKILACGSDSSCTRNEIASALQAILPNVPRDVLRAAVDVVLESVPILIQEGFSRTAAKKIGLKLSENALIAKYPQHEWLIKNVEALLERVLID